ncbi:MAG: TPM domain-containing protein [Bacteriovorax sp.]|nr:TPM domain-containing protein [Bacteriovorax sp.]
MIISNKDKLLIKNLITQAEKRTQSEIVPMITHHSDIYPAAHFRAAIILSFLFSLALYFSPLNIINPIYFLWIQIPGLYFGYFLGHFSFIKKLLITQDEMNKEVEQKAYEAFFHHNLHLTKHHNGVLILISVMERKIKIIADIGISKKVEQKVFDEIIFQFTQKIKDGNFVGGLSDSIESVTNVLETYFPATGEKSNELNNDLIIEE